MAFELFLLKTQKMFNIFKNQSEPMTDEAKVHFLLKKTQCPQLANAVASMKTRLLTEPPGTITYTNVSNHLASCASELPDYIAKNRNISAVKMAPKSGVAREDGSIHTGFYPNWRQLTQQEREKVVDKRKKQKQKRKPAGGQPSTVKTELENLKKKLGKHKRTIAALKNKIGKEKDVATESNDDEGDDPTSDAGDGFGGKRAKKVKKQ